MRLIPVSRIVKGKDEYKILFAISLAAFIVQLITLRPAVVYGEPYLIAQNLYKGFGFSFYYPPDTLITPTCYIPPLYAFYLYIVMLVGGGAAAMQISGLVFLGASNFFLYNFFKRCLPASVAFVGFFIFAWYVPFWVIAEKIDVDALNILLLSMTIFVLSGFLKKQTYTQWAILGILFGVQILIRPDMLFGIIFFGVWLMFVVSSKTKFIKGFGLTLVLAALIVAPWTIRNYNTFGRFVLVSANSGYNFFLGNNPTATGEFQQQPATAESIAMDSARAGYFRTHLSPVDRDEYMMKSATDWAKSHPLNILVLGAKKFYFHWWMRESAGFNAKVPSWMVACYDIGSLLLVMLGVIGLLQLPRKAAALLFTLFSYSTIIAMIFFVQSRHRALKVDPYLITLSVAGIYQIAVRKKVNVEVRNTLDQKK